MAVGPRATLWYNPVREKRMTLTLELPPELDSRLHVEAERRGIAISEHGIFTFNPADFSRYPGITAIHPQNVP